MIRPWLPALLLLGVALSALSARARELDPAVPQRFALDPVRASTSSPSQGSLPRNASVAFRLRVANAVAHPPAVTPDKTVLIAHADPVLAEYDARGRSLWAARLGPNPAATSPFVFADGTRAVITEGGELVGFSPRGRSVFRARLPFGTIGPSLVVAPLGDGGLLLAERQRVVGLDAAGTLRFRAELDKDVSTILPGLAPAAGADALSTRALLVTRGGSVLDLGSDGRSTWRARFSGNVTAAARLGASRVLGVLDAQRLVELDLVADTEKLLAEAADFSLLPELAVNRRGESRVLGSNDLLLAFDAAGAERFRVPFATPATGPEPRDGAAELLFDSAGTTLVARAGAGVFSISADGVVTRVESSACPEPLRPALLPPSSVVVACRSGILLRLEAAAPPAASDTPR